MVRETYGRIETESTEDGPVLDDGGTVGKVTVCLRKC